MPLAKRYPNPHLVYVIHRAHERGCLHFGWSRQSRNGRHYDVQERFLASSLVIRAVRRGRSEEPDRDKIRFYGRRHRPAFVRTRADPAGLWRNTRGRRTKCTMGGPGQWLAGCRMERPTEGPFCSPSLIPRRHATRRQMKTEGRPSPPCG